jgi:DNA adenine methylase
MGFSKVPSTLKVVNVASVPHRSPFRYPGGKTWLIPYVRLWLRGVGAPVRELIEPFAGGAIVGLTAAFEGLAKRVTLVELDSEVAAVWKTILGRDGEWLAERILNFGLTSQTVKEVLRSDSPSVRENAFRTILRNRVQRGGILAPGAGLMRNGENGKGLVSRWYPETLHRRILDIVRVRHKIKFVHGDGIGYMERRLPGRGLTFFMDPPYVIAGRRLYKHSEIDHEKLFCIAKRLAGDFLLTYDDSEEIRRLIIQFRFDCETVPMMNTHNATMYELLISRDLRWLRNARSLQPAFHESVVRTQPAEQGHLL